MLMIDIHYWVYYYDLKYYNQSLNLRNNFLPDDSTGYILIIILAFLSSLSPGNLAHLADGTKQ